MAEPIVVLPPDERGDQQVQRRHGRTPVHQVLCLIQPFGMLVEHRVNDVDECLIGGEQAMPTRQHIAFQPAFQCLFTQDFHDAPGGRQVAAIADSRLLAVSSGPNTRNRSKFMRITSRRYSPSTCVACAVSTPGSSTAI
ncbi:hypothetical protein G6F68_018799 [Rhizopus microsporus]|nr:hypothetical protein G6F68_018799 [Rhizopus microsporus]